MRLKNFFRAGAVRAATGSILLFSSLAASAATIELTPSTVNQPVGSDFMLDIVGRNFDLGTNGSTSAGTSGGGLLITWDDSIIDLQGGLAGLNITFAGDQTFGDPAVLGAGSLSFGVTSFFGDPNANFDIATLTFDALMPGVTTATVDVSVTDIWADYDSLTDMTPTGVGSTITITSTAVVPVPAAVWLFGSGLLGLVGVARRRSAA